MPDGIGSLLWMDLWLNFRRAQHGPSGARICFNDHTAWSDDRSFLFVESWLMAGTMLWGPWVSLGVTVLAVAAVLRLI